MTGTAYDSLVEKLHPQSWPNLSGRMIAIVACILGQEWTTPQMHGIAITADGHVTCMEDYIGLASDFERNIAGLLEHANLTPEERAEWDRLYSQIDDWRITA